jgi:hypothetical protein
MNEKQVYHFMENYERLSNTYNFDKIAPLINERAIFFFSDRTLE